MVNSPAVQAVKSEVTTLLRWADRERERILNTSHKIDNNITRDVSTNNNHFIDIYNNSQTNQIDGNKNNINCIQEGRNILDGARGRMEKTFQIISDRGSSEDLYLSSFKTQQFSPRLLHSSTRPALPTHLHDTSAVNTLSKSSLKPKQKTKKTSAMKKLSSASKYVEKNEYNLENQGIMTNNDRDTGEADLQIMNTLVSKNEIKNNETSFSKFNKSNLNSAKKQPMLMSVESNINIRQSRIEKKKVGNVVIRRSNQKFTIQQMNIMIKEVREMKENETKMTKLFEKVRSTVNEKPSTHKQIKVFRPLVHQNIYNHSGNDSGQRRIISDNQTYVSSVQSTSKMHSAKSKLAVIHNPIIFIPPANVTVILPGVNIRGKNVRKKVDVNPQKVGYYEYRYKGDDEMPLEKSMYKVRRVSLTSSDDVESNEESMIESIDDDQKDDNIFKGNENDVNIVGRISTFQTKDSWGLNKNDNQDLQNNRIGRTDEAISKDDNIVRKSELQQLIVIDDNFARGQLTTTTKYNNTVTQEEDGLGISVTNPKKMKVKQFTKSFREKCAISEVLNVISIPNSDDNYVRNGIHTQEQSVVSQTETLSQLASDIVNHESPIPDNDYDLVLNRFLTDKDDNVKEMETDDVEHNNGERLDLKDVTAQIYGQMQLLNCVKNDKKINDNVHRAVDIRALYKVSLPMREELSGVLLSQLPEDITADTDTLSFEETSTVTSVTESQDEQGNEESASNAEMTRNGKETVKQNQKEYEEEWEESDNSTSSSSSAESVLTTSNRNNGIDELQTEYSHEELPLISDVYPSKLTDLKKSSISLDCNTIIVNDIDNTSTDIGLEASAYKTYISVEASTQVSSPDMINKSTITDQYDITERSGINIGRIEGIENCESSVILNDGMNTLVSESQNSAAYNSQKHDSNMEKIRSSKIEEEFTNSEISNDSKLQATDVNITDCNSKIKKLSNTAESRGNCDRVMQFDKVIPEEKISVAMNLSLLNILHPKMPQTVDDEAEGDPNTNIKKPPINVDDQNRPPVFQIDISQINASEIENNTFDIDQQPTEIIFCDSHEDVEYIDSTGHDSSSVSNSAQFASNSVSQGELLLSSETESQANLIGVWEEADSTNTFQQTLDRLQSSKVVSHLTQDKQGVLYPCNSYDSNNDEACSISEGCSLAEYVKKMTSTHDSFEEGEIILGDRNTGNNTLSTSTITEEESTINESERREIVNRTSLHQQSKVIGTIACNFTEIHNNPYEIASSVCVVQKEIDDLRSDQEDHVDHDLPNSPRQSGDLSVRPKVKTFSPLKQIIYAETSSRRTIRNSPEKKLNKLPSTELLNGGAAYQVRSIFGNEQDASHNIAHRKLHHDEEFLPKQTSNTSQSDINIFGCYETQTSVTNKETQELRDANNTLLARLHSFGKFNFLREND